MYIVQSLKFCSQPLGLFSSYKKAAKFANTFVNNFNHNVEVFHIKKNNKCIGSFKERFIFLNKESNVQVKLGKQILSKYLSIEDVELLPIYGAPCPENISSDELNKLMHLNFSIGKFIKYEFLY